MMQPTVVFMLPNNIPSNQPTYQFIMPNSQNLEQITSHPLIPMSNSVLPQNNDVTHQKTIPPLMVPYQLPIVSTKSANMLCPTQHNLVVSAQNCDNAITDTGSDAPKTNYPLLRSQRGRNVTVQSEKYAISETKPQKIFPTLKDSNPLSDQDSLDTTAAGRTQNHENSEIPVDQNASNQSSGSQALKMSSNKTNYELYEDDSIRLEIKMKRTNNNAAETSTSSNQNINGMVMSPSLFNQQLVFISKPEEKLKHQLFICPKCNAGLPDAKQLEMHMVVFHNKLYKCVCGKSLESFVGLKLHRRNCPILKNSSNSSENDLSADCKANNGIGNSDSLVANTKSDQTGEYEDQSTENGASISENCINQMSSPHGVPESLSDEFSSDSHIVSVADDGFTSPKETEVEDESANSFISSEMKRAEESIPTVTKCLNCNTVVQKKDLYTTRCCTKPSQQHICQVCGKVFPKLFHLKQHIQIHLNKKERNFKCQICEKSFKTIKALFIHSRLHFRESIQGKQYKCDECDLLFRLKSDLKKHTLSHSANIPVFKCDLCNIKFSSETVLNTHMKTHYFGTGPVFSCDECGAQFKSKRKFDGHKIYHTNSNTTLHIANSEPNQNVPILNQVSGDAFQSQVCFIQTPSSQNIADPVPFTAVSFDSQKPDKTVAAPNHASYESSQPLNLPLVTSNILNVADHLPVAPVSFNNLASSMSNEDSTNPSTIKKEKLPFETSNIPNFADHLPVAPFAPASFNNISISMPNGDSTNPPTIKNEEGTDSIFPLKVEVNPDNPLGNLNGSNSNCPNCKLSNCKSVCGKTLESLERKSSNSNEIDSSADCEASNGIDSSDSLVANSKSDQTGEYEDQSTENEASISENCINQMSSPHGVPESLSDEFSSDSHIISVADDGFTSPKETEVEDESANSFISSEMKRAEESIPTVTKCLNCNTVVQKKDLYTTRCCTKPSQQHICQVCGKVFPKLFHLKQHIQIHLNKKERNFKCQICEKSFKTIKALFIHSRLHFRESIQGKQYKCDECDLLFRLKSDLKKHTLSHSANIPVFKCDLCNIKFSSETVLNTHMKTHYFGTGPVFLCDECGTPFKSKRKLDCHKIYHTNSNTTLHIANSEPNQNVPILNQVSSDAFQSQVCFIQTPSTQNIADPVPFTAVSFGSQKPDQTVAAPNQASYESSQPENLPLDTSNIPNVNDHLPVVPFTPVSFNNISISMPNGDSTNPPTIKNEEGTDSIFPLKVEANPDNPLGNLNESNSNCPNCKFPVVNVAAHYFHCHMKSHKHLCNLCGNRFKTKAALYTHIRLHHPSAYLKCEKCNLSFRLKSDLKKHSLSHLDNVPVFKCDVCGGLFSSELVLRKHMMTHFKGLILPSDTEEKRKIIKLYPKESSFTCKICDEQFSSHTQLDEHLRIHFTSKRFVCEYCGKVFNASGNLKVHIRSHTMDKKYKCGMCEKGFTQLGNLKYHLKTHSVIRS